MDIIGEITSKLGIEQNQAEGLAGAVLGLVKSQVAEKVGPAEAQALADKVPELEAWQAKAQTVEAGAAPSGVLGALSGLMGGGDGGFDLGALTKLASDFKLDGSAAAKLAPIALGFLKSRVDSDLLKKIESAIPMLSGGASGGLGGMLGGLLGR